MRLKHPGKRAIKAWIVRQMADDPELSILVDLALSADRRSWLRAFDQPESIATISTPWGPMSRWFAASTIVKDWSKLWKAR